MATSTKVAGTRQTDGSAARPARTGTPGLARWALRLGRHRSDSCRASGWGVRLGCTDGRGSMVCPVCEETVKALLAPDLGPQVRVIAGH